MATRGQYPPQGPCQPYGFSFYKLRVVGFPYQWPVKLLADQFAKHGGRIDNIGPDKHNRDTFFVSFDIMPNGSIEGAKYQVNYGGKTRLLKVTRIREYPGFVQSPSNPVERLPVKVSLQASSIAVGIMTGPLHMTKRGRIPSPTGHPITLKVHLKNDVQDLVVEFPGPRSGRPYQALIRLAYIAHVYEDAGPDRVRLLTLHFRYPPKFVKVEGMDQLFPGSQREFNRDRAFVRATELDPAPEPARSLDPLRAVLRPLSLFKVASGAEQAIDLGRCLVWRFRISPVMNANGALEQLRSIFQAFNIPYSREAGLTVYDRDKSFAWATHGPYNRPKPSKSAFEALQVIDHVNLPFEIWYLLEVAISRKLLYEGNFTFDFLDRLRRDARAKIMLTNFVMSERECPEPMELFQKSELMSQPRHRLPKTCVMMHSVTVTPTSLLVHPPQVEVSNRVIRRYSELADRFLRVRFSDEVYFGRIFSSPGRSTQDEVFARVRHVLINGIHVGGRHYQFLACGSSQFREHGAYFFAPNEHVTINSIRQFMGYFQHIRVIAKYVARLGQCFSTTKAATSIGQKPDITKIQDVVRNGYTFTDGVGKMSPFLAHMVSQELRLGPTPSVFQFRMGGYKGVLAVDPTLSGRAVHVRDSQCKFTSDFNQLEIIRVSSFASAYLNKQLILVLENLGIPDKIFVNKAKYQLEEINRALEDDQFAIDMLMHQVDYNQITVEMAKMLAFGMRDDPFVDGILRLWRVWIIKLLKEKANLFVPKGAFLLGCVDETNTLRFDRNKPPQIFLQVPEANFVPANPDMAPISGAPGYCVVTGYCVMARNPALHPGDIRIVEAVDCKALHHLRDVVVLTQQGDRDLANMCSGGDLDGDDFLVMWDPDLLISEQVSPMDYTAPEPKLSSGPVTQSDMISFIVEYMKNDSLGSIAVAHRGWADKTTLRSATCLRLANLHSMAVDYAKSGQPARLEEEDRLRQYPHWEGKPKHISYHSKKVLGQIYDLISNVKPTLEVGGNEHDAAVGAPAKNGTVRENTAATPRAPAAMLAKATDAPPGAGHTYPLSTWPPNGMRTSPQKSSWVQVGKHSIREESFKQVEHTHSPSSSSAASDAAPSTDISPSATPAPVSTIPSEFLAPSALSSRFFPAILSAYNVPKALLDALRAIKADYDTALLRIMAQYGIKTEYELYTAFVLQHNRELRDFKCAEELGTLMGQIRKGFRQDCLQAGGAEERPITQEQWDTLGTVVVGCYKVAAEEAAAAELGAEARLASPVWQKHTLISFPWVFTDELLAVSQMVRSPDEPTLREAMDKNRAMLGNIRKGFAGRVDRVRAMEELRAGRAAEEAKMEKVQVAQTDVDDQATGASASSAEYESAPSSTVGGEEYHTPPQDDKAVLENVLAQQAGTVPRIDKAMDELEMLLGRASLR